MSEEQASGSLLSEAAAPAEAPGQEAPAKEEIAAPAVADVTFPDNWKDALEVDIKDDPSMAAIKDVKSLAKSYVHAQRMVGQEKFMVPGKYATEEEWSNVYTKLGRPDAADKYEFKLPEGVEDKDIADYKEAAHKAGLNSKQAQALMDWNHARAQGEMKAKHEADAVSVDKQIKELKQEWGAAFDKNVNAARFALSEFEVDGARELFDSTGLGNHPVVLKLFSKIGEALGEDKIKGEGNGELGMTPSQVDKKITEMMSDMNGPYRDPKHPGHGAAVQEMQHLFEVKHRAS